MKRSRTVNAGILSFGRALTKVVGLVSAMILARVFAKEDYATYRQSLMIYTFAAPILSLGLPQAIYYFMPNQPDRKRNILANNMATLALTGSLLTAFLLFGGSDFLAKQFNNPELAKTLRVMAWYPLFMFPVSGLGACLMVNNRVKQVASYNIISRIVMFVTVITPVFIWRTPFAGVVGFVLAAAVVMGPALWLMLRAADTGIYRPDLSGIKEQLRFAVPLGLAGIIGQLSVNLDKILVSKFFDPETFAVYVNGAMEIPLIGMITGSATAVLLPDITRMLGTGKNEEALALWKRAAVKCATIIFPVMGFLMVMAPELMALLYGEKYVGSAVPFRIYLLLLPIRIAFFGTIFMGAGKSHLVLTMSAVALLLKIPISIYLVQRIGYLGPAVATVLVVYLWGKAFDVFWARRLLKTSYREILPYRDLSKMLLAIFVASVVAFATSLLCVYNLYAKMMLCACIYGACVMLLFNRLGVIKIKQVVMLVKEKIARWALGKRV
jgi:O-antigen/teichoic acid export membrane protein